MTIELVEDAVASTQSDTLDYAAMLSNHKFEEDYRVSNPGLHMLYTVWAVKHLRSLDESIQKLADHSNSNLHGAILSLIEERNSMIETSASNCQAAVILNSLGLDSSSTIIKGE